MKIVVDTQHAKTECSVNQEVTRQSPTVNQGPATHHVAHEFRWVETKSGGTALCTCGGWELYGRRPNALTKESGQRNHALHRANLSDRAVGHDGDIDSLNRNREDEQRWRP